MSNLADIRPKPIKVILDKERSLVYDFNALALIEEHYGSLADAMEALNKGSFKAIQVFLWAGLVHEDENLSLKEVGKWVPGVVLNLSDKVTEALNAALPEAQKNTGKAL